MLLHELRPESAGEEEVALGHQLGGEGAHAAGDQGVGEVAVDQAVNNADLREGKVVVRARVFVLAIPELYQTSLCHLIHRLPSVIKTIHVYKD